MQEKNLSNFARRFFAAFLTAVMVAGMAAPTAYAAADGRPIVTETADETQQQAQTPAAGENADGEADINAELAYYDKYENAAPEGSEYAGTLDGLGMNIYKKTATYEDLGFSSAAEMDEAFAAARAEAEEESQKEYDKNMAWLNSMLTADDLAPMREEAEQISEAVALLQDDTDIDAERPVVLADADADRAVIAEESGESAPETATQETAATPETAKSDTANDSAALYAAESDTETLAQKKADAAALLAAKGIDLSGNGNEAAEHFSISTVQDTMDTVSVMDAQNSSSATASVTVVDDDSVVVCVYDENNKPLSAALVQIQWKYQENGVTKTVTRGAVTGSEGDGKGVALISNMGPNTCEDKSDLHRGYVMVSCNGYRTVEQFDADFNAGTRINFKLTKLSNDDKTPYASAIDLDGVNLLDTTYTLNLSPKANDPYDMTITMRNVNQDFDGQVALYRIADEEEKPAATLTEIPTGNLIAATSASKEETSFTAVFNKRWGTLEYGAGHMLAPKDKLYLYWRGKDGNWHRYSQINLAVDMATNDAAWKEISVSLTGTGDTSLTLPKGLGTLNLDVMHLNFYGMIDLSGKFMIGYGRDWFSEKDKPTFESSAYKPSGKRLSQIWERIKSDMTDKINDKSQIYDFTEPTTIMGDWDATFSVYGCFMGQYNGATGYWSADVALAASFAAQGSATFYLFVPIPPVGLPVYAGIEGSGAAEVQAIVGAQFKEGDWATILRTLQVSNQAGITVNVNLSAGVYAGIGLRKVISAEANLACSLDMIFGFGTANTRGQHYPFHTQGVFDWGLTIRARVFFITYTYEVFADEENPKPGQKIVLWDKWLGDPIGNYQTQALLMQNVAQDTDSIAAYSTDMDAVSEGVYDADSGEVSMTGQAAMLAAVQTNTNENTLADNVLSGASMQLLTAQGGKNKGSSYLFRIASVTDKATGKATPRLTVQNGGTCSSTLGETYVLPAPTTGEDAGKLPHDYNFAVCDDSDGGTGNFTIAVTTGYLDESASLRERAHDLRVRVYRFDSEKNTFTELYTFMPMWENYGYCGTPAVYTRGDKYFVAVPVQRNVGDPQMVTEQISNSIAWVTNIKEYGNGKEQLIRTDSFTRMLLKPTDSSMEIYVEDSYEEMLYRYEVDTSRGFRQADNGYELVIDGEIGSGQSITNLSYINGCPGKNNRIVFTTGNKLWMPFTEWNGNYEETVCFELKDASGNEIVVPTAENSLLIFSDNKPSERVSVGDSFHAIAITSTGDGGEEQSSRIYSYDFTYRSKQAKSSRNDHTRYICPNAVRNQMQIMQGRSISSFTGSYHPNTVNPEAKDLRLIYMADDEDTVTSAPDAKGVGTVVSKCTLYNYELKKVRDAAITQFTIANKSVDKKDGTFNVTFTVKNTGVAAFENVTLTLKQDGGHALTMGTTESTAVTAALSEDKTEITLTPKKGNLAPGEAIAYTAKVNIPLTWLSGDVSLTASITKIDGKPLSEWNVEPYAVAAYAAEPDSADDAYSVTEKIDKPTIDMQVQELVYNGIDGKEEHYAEITFRNDNILSIENAELQVYGYTADGTDFVKLQSFDLEELKADSKWQKDNAGYTVLLPIPDAWRQQGHTEYGDLWLLYFALCDKGADPFGLDKNADKSKTTYDLEFITNIEVELVSTVKTETEDSFKGSVVPAEDGTYGDGDYQDGETVTIKAQPETGYVFAGWYYKDGYFDGDMYHEDPNKLFSDEATHTFTVNTDEDYCLVARFKPDPANPASRVSVTVSENENGVPLGQVTADYSTADVEARMTADGSYAFAVFQGKSLRLKASAYDEENYLFDGWYLLDADGNPTGDALSRNAEFTYTAQGDSAVQAVFIPMPASCVKVYLNPGEGYGADLGWQRTGVDGKLKTLPEAKCDGYTFQGWFTAPDGGEAVTVETVFTERTMVYAHYKESTDPVQPSDPAKPSTPTQPGEQNGTDTSADSSTSTKKSAAQAAAVIPRTADDFPLAIVVVLLVIGAGGFAVMAWLRKRKK